MLGIVGKVFNLGVWKMIIFHEPDEVLGANNGWIEKTI